MIQIFFSFTILQLLKYTCITNYQKQKRKKATTKNINTVQTVLPIYFIGKLLK